MKNRRFGIGIFVMVSIFLLAPHFEHSPFSAELTKLRVGKAGEASYYVILFAAEEKGFYKEQGLDVEVTIIERLKMLPAVVTGALDLIATQTNRAILVLSQGAAVRMIGSYTLKPAYDIVAQPEVKSVKDLKGKIIDVSELKSGLTLMA